MKLLKSIIPALILIFIWSGCKDPDKDARLQIRASGKPGEIILVMDSLHWNTELGVEISKTFKEEVVGLPRPEPLFTVRMIQPLDFNSILKYAQNIIIISVLDNYSKGSEKVKNYFTQNSLKRIESEPDLFLLTQKNQWARGQEILYLFGKDEQTLISNIQENRDKIRQHFNNIEKRRLVSSLYKAKELEEVEQVLYRDHDFKLRVPFGYQIAYEKEGSNFIWLRKLDGEFDKHIWIYYQDYRSEDVFESSNIIDLRNDATKKYIFQDKDWNDTSYVVVETRFIPPVFKEVNFNDKYAIETRGLWKTNNLTMGGPFLGYTLVDESLNRVYYIDGFVYSPGKPQREAIREIETILWTFETSNEAKASF